MQLRCGHICTAIITPERGNAKLRPVIIVSPDTEIRDEGDVRVVAVSTTFKDPLSADQIDLPWERMGRCATGLARRSVAVCTWLDKLPRSSIREVKGFVPAPILLRILQRLRETLQVPDDQSHNN
jgi:mRNA-degrading endonuclease toxin of MazEF toxin-antitoxin module